jgi:tetratricopeptide (TPR) repeat protein
MARIGSKARNAGAAAGWVATIALLARPTACAQPVVHDAGEPPAAHAQSAPSQENVDGLIAKGRALLAEGKAAEAQAAFEAAEKIDGATIKTRMWTLRSWLAQGRVNDALDAIDKLDHAGQKGPEMDYLYGMAFAAKAKGYINERAPGGVIGMAFTDAVDFLGRATKADPVRFADAFLPLAESAWYAHDLPTARAAADNAVANAPKDPDTHAMLGQVALAQYRTLIEDASQKAAADAAWESARAANARVVELLSGRDTPDARARLAAAHVELARCFGWKKMTADVAREYGAAIAADPTAVDYNEVRNVLGGSDFLAALEAGEQAFVARAGAADKGDAGLLWWLGFARFLEKKYPEAETAFQSAVTKQPENWNSWFYIALARYHQQKYAEAIAALRKNFEENPNDLVSSIDASRDSNIPILDYLIGWSAGKNKNLDAAFLSEIEVAVVPDHAPYWNNLGLFYRDAGDELAKSKKVEDKTRARELWEKALASYERAVALSPDDPNFLNDLAVVLHYNLGRDLERAKTLYARAYERAQAELKRTDLSPDMRVVRETALRDSKNNLELLTHQMEKAKAPEKDGGEKKDGAKKEGEKKSGGNDAASKQDGPQ